MRNEDDAFFETLLLMEAGFIDRDRYCYDVLSNPVGVTYARHEKHDGRVQARPAALRQQEGASGDQPQASDSHRAERGSQGRETGSGEK